MSVVPKRLCHVIICLTLNPAGIGRIAVMITLEALKQFGADTDKGLAMCMGNEALYLRLVGSVPNEAGFEKLAQSIGSKDYDAAFDAAHALKGVLGNLSLTPMFEKASEITDLLRSRTDTDYSSLLSQLSGMRDELAKLCE